MLVQRGKSWRWIIDFQNCTRFNDTVFSCFRPDDFLHSGKIKLWPIVIWTICSQTLTLCRPYPSIYIPFILDWIYKVSWPKGSRLLWDRTRFLCHQLRQSRRNFRTSVPNWPSSNNGRRYRWCNLHHSWQNDTHHLKAPAQSQEIWTNCLWSVTP